MKKTSHKMFYLKSVIVALVVFVSGFLIGSIDTSEDCRAVQANVLATTETQPNNDPIATGTEPGTSTKPESTPATEETPPASVDILDSTTTAYLGSENAPVTIVEFTDYQCPFCQKYYFGAFKDIIEEYVKAGKVKYVMKSLPLPFHSEARNAAYATYCAGEQNAVWAMHKRLFVYQNEWGYDENPSQKFAEYAYQIGLNEDAFTSCMETADDKYDDKIDTDIKFAAGYKITGTPSFLINGTPLIGAQPFKNFKAIIENAL